LRSAVVHTVCITIQSDIISHQHDYSPTTEILYVLPSGVYSLHANAIGRHTFPVAGACTWNDLPSDITSSPSLLTFKQAMTKIALISSVLSQSHLLTVQTANCFLFVVLEVAVRCLGHVKKLN